MFLNHLDLPTQALDASAEFFCQYFGFQLFVRHPERAVLKDAGDFILILNDTGPLPQAQEMHLGFLLDTVEAVEAVYAQLQAAEQVIAVPLQKAQGQCLFYCLSPGGLTVEVAWRRPRPRA